jgi:uncharacterized surface protein with fasciclin (FAS1) repeats
MFNKLKVLIFSFATLASAAVFAGNHGSDHSYKKDIVDTAANTPDFATLVSAVKAADLVRTLKSDGERCS